MSDAPVPQPAVKPKRMPPNLFMPLHVSRIDNGRMTKKLQKTLEEAAAALDQHRAKADGKGKAVVNLQITLMPTKDMDGHTDISYVVTSKLPVAAKRMYYKTAPNGGLLTEATDEAVRSLAGDVDQIPLFTMLGEEKVTVDPKTLNVVADADVAGKIAPTAPA